MTPIEQLQAYLAAQPDVVLAYLFGSRATGRADAASDYDIAVLTQHSLSSARRHQLAGELGMLLNGAAVDLVPLQRAPVELAYAVVAQGQCLVERDRAARVEWEAGILSRYADALPVLRQQRADLLRGEHDEAGVRRYRAAFRKTERMLAEVGAAAQQNAG